MPSHHLKATPATAIVIGAGIGGLATAIRLARQGFAVSVYEAAEGPGGKLGELHAEGYRFDTGPSLFTLPQLVEELFALCGERTADHFNYVRLPEITRYFWENGLRLTAHADPEAFAQEVAAKTGEPAAHVHTFLQDAARKYALAAPFFLEQSLHRRSTYLTRKAFRAFLSLPRLQTHTTMSRTIHSRFKHPQVRQLFHRYATYNGSNPYHAPATLNMIPHLEFNEGAWLPKGGLRAIPLALEALARRQGVQFHYGQPVQEILLQGRRATGVRLADGSAHTARVVVCNLDVFNAYHHLLPGLRKPHRTLNQERSSSALIFYWGVRAQFPQLDVHNIFFTEDYPAEFQALFQHKSLAADPTVYVNITSKVEATDAPPGCENWFVMINAPSLDGQDWDTLIPQARAHILTKLSRMLGTDIAPLIETEHLLSPELIQQRTGSWRGALYGTASNNRFAAFLRHPNFSKRVQGLYFCGGSVHPGGGIPLCLQSARIVAGLVAKDAGRARI